MMGSFVEAQDEERGKVAITIISRPFCLLFQLQVVWGWVRWVSGWVTFLGMLDMVCGRLWCEEPLLAESAVPYIRENLKHFLDSNPDACMPSWKIHGCTEIRTIAKFSCILYIELLILKPH